MKKKKLPNDMFLNPQDYEVHVSSNFADESDKSLVEISIKLGDQRISHYSAIKSEVKRLGEWFLKVAEGME